MKTTIVTACITTVAALGNLTWAENFVLERQDSEESQQAPPPTTKMRVANLKTRHQESLSALNATLSQLSNDPSQLTSKETFAAIDKADREMKRTKSASDSIIATVKAQFASVAKDSAFSDEQKEELKVAATAMGEECVALSREAGVVGKKLDSMFKELAKAKKIYQSYLNLQGEQEAKDKLKTIIEDYVKKLTETPAEDSGDKPGADGQSNEKTKDA